MEIQSSHLEWRAAPVLSFPWLGLDRWGTTVRRVTPPSRWAISHGVSGLSKLNSHTEER